MATVCRQIFDLSNSIGAAQLAGGSEHTFKTAVCIAAEMGHTECLTAIIRYDHLPLSCDLPVM